MQNNFIICHYGEIGLKGKNRKFFEEKLVENIKKALSKGSFKNVRRISGRLLIELKGMQGTRFLVKEPSSLQKIGECLSNVFGIANFSFVLSCQQDIEAIKKKAVEMLTEQEFNTFRITTQRSEKKFALTSQQVDGQVGAFVVENLNKKVNLTKPNVTLFIEIVEKFAFLYLEKNRGLAGLPVGVSGKAVSLLSGGIDSPVASFLAQGRGIELVFVHFHSYPFTNKASVDKVKKIVELLNKYQFESKLYLAPFDKIQKEILLKTKANIRVVLYRRFMFKIAEAIANREKAKALITGESVGQVASQTLENIAAIEEAVDMPVLRPLITQDKQEIITGAKAIGAYEISILPHQDCCSRFLPKHPVTKANLREVKQEETKLDVKVLIEKALKKVEIITVTM